MKIWNWGPTTIWHNMTCAQNYFQKSLHPTVYYAHSNLTEALMPCSHVCGVPIIQRYFSGDPEAPANRSGWWRHHPGAVVRQPVGHGTPNAVASAAIHWGRTGGHKSPP